MTVSALSAPSSRRIDPVSRMLWEMRSVDGLNSSGVPILRTGQAASFARASEGNAIDGNGILRRNVHSAIRREVVGGRVGYRIERAHVNLATYPNTFNAWTATNVSVAGNRPDPFGLPFTLGNGWELTANIAGGVLDGAVGAFTGTVVKSVGLHIRQGTASVNTFGLYDFTASAWLGSMGISWSGGVPSFAQNAGTVNPFTAEYLGGGWCSIGFQSGAVTNTGHSHGIRIFPGGAGTGSLYVYGAGAYDSETLPRYVATSTAEDVLTSTADWADTADESWYFELARPTWANVAHMGSRAMFLLTRGDSGVAPSLYAWIDADSVIHARAAVSGGVSEATIAFPAGDVVRILAQFRNFTTAPQVRLDVSGTPGSWATAGGSPLTAIASRQITVGGAYSGGYALSGVLYRAAIARGLPTFDQMAA